MRGPNYWSDVYKKLLVIKIDLEETPYFTNEINGFDEKLNKIIAVFHEPDPKPLTGIPETFATLVTLLQQSAGLPARFFKLLNTPSEKKIIILIEYFNEEVGLEAVYIAEDIIYDLIKGIDIDLVPDIEYLEKIRTKTSPEFNMGILLKEAEKRGIPYNRGFYEKDTIFGYGANQKKMNGVISDTAGFMALEISADKDLTSEILQMAKISVPPTSDIKDNDYNLLIINKKFTAAVKRIPAYLKGDGFSTIQQLIDKENQRRSASSDGENVLTTIEIDESTSNRLKNKDLKLSSVLRKGETLFISEVSNVSRGNITYNVTEEVHQHNRFLAERISRIIGLDLCGIDIIADDLATPFYEHDLAVIKVNPSPDIKEHIAPTKGESINAAGAILNMLFPEKSIFRIPIVAVTGTNGKTTVTRFIAHLAKIAGYNVGFTTTEGIYINDVNIMEGDCSGPKSAKLVLKDPTVDYAVLETARGGILKSGLAFDSCDIAVVTNVSADHLGLKDIYTLEELARVKMVVPRSVTPTGFAILNAEDDLVYKMAEGLNCKTAFFSLEKDNKRIISHVKKGGIAAVIENGFVTILHGDLTMRMEEVKNIPLTLGGKAEFMIKNTLPVVLYGYITGMNSEVLKKGLRSFNASEKTTPGRLNLFNFKNFLVLADYAHNPAGYDAIGKVINQFKVNWKIGVIAAQGDRTDDFIVSIGRKGAELFDEIIIRNNKSLRGRKEEDLHNLLLKGIHEVKENIPVSIVKSEGKAVEFAIKNAKKNSLVTIFTEAVNETLSLIKRLKEEEEIILQD